ncbi:MAG TPA: hypothetical protein VFM46_10995, partial [Pseudomonadales bacterium]|nr:hypothetical protein [Pseudomonadales bacterium]
MAETWAEEAPALTVIKGPQSVLYGPGSTAATVLFERKIDFFDKPGLRGYASALGRNGDRNDAFADIQFGNQNGYGQLIGTHSHANDYQDGDGSAFADDADVRQVGLFSELKHTHSARKKLIG